MVPQQVFGRCDTEGGSPCLQHLPVSVCIRTFSTANIKLLARSQNVCPRVLQNPHPKHFFKIAFATLWVANSITSYLHWDHPVPTPGDYSVNMGGSHSKDKRLCSAMMPVIPHLDAVHTHLWLAVVYLSNEWGRRQHFGAWLTSLQKLNRSLLKI